MGTSLLAQTEGWSDQQKASDVQRAVYPFGETVQRFQHTHIYPDVSGLIKPPPLGSGQRQVTQECEWLVAMVMICAALKYK